MLGISSDSEKSHQKFIAKQELPFSLIADTDKTINIRTLRNTYRHARTAHFVANKQEGLAQLVHALLRGEKVGSVVRG